MSAAQTSPHGGSGPLAGVRVIDLTVNVLGPLATMLLGDLGADVIKVETPDGEPNRRTGPSRNANMSAMHMNINRSKRSVTLNLKRPAAYEALLKLISGADVFVHSMRPAAAQRLGIDYETLAAINPRLIYAFAPGYLQHGPRANDPAFDDVLQGESGIADLMLKSVGKARYLPTVLVDKFCGYALSSAVSMALYAREKTGKGQRVEQPMFETLVAFNLHEHLWGAAFDPPLGAGIGYVRLLSEQRRPYETQDGYICVLAVNDDQWRRLLPVIGRAELVDDERFLTVESRLKHIDAVYGVVSEQMALKTTAEWHTALDAIDIPNGVMAKFEDLLQDPYLAETGFLRKYIHPTEGPMITTNVPTQFSATPAGIPLPPPTLGQHNHEVLRAIGYSDSEIKALTD
jgi:crotonobetainyl-CoA:carnitine CoA-transferase CaiB-like acyl-CoA transferase